MGGLARVADAIDALTGWVGRLAAWLILPVVLIAFGVVLLRYAFSIGFPWLQESYIWLHGGAFLAAAAWVLREEGHVRVDLLYKRWSRRGRAWADLLGVVAFLLPMMGTILTMAWPLVARSWRIGEKSPTSDGMHYLFLLKSLVLVFCVLIILQGIAMAIRAILVLAGRDDLAGNRVAGHA